MGRHAGRLGAGRLVAEEGKSDGRVVVVREWRAVQHAIERRAKQHRKQQQPAEQSTTVQARTGRDRLAEQWTDHRFT